MRLQTWLPFPNYAVSAFFLQDRELQESLNGARETQAALQGSMLGYSKHPTVQMWRGHIISLMVYGDCMLREWRRRGYYTSHSEMAPHLVRTKRLDETRDYVVPEWLGNREFHANQRAVLRTRNREFYDRLQWAEEPERTIIWPPGVVT